MDLGTQRDDLFLAVTRPSMVLGVTMEALLLNGILSGCLFVASSRFECVAVAAVVHGVCRAITYRDHNAFRVLAVWVETRGRCRTASEWGGSSATPLRLVRHFDARDLT